MPAHVRLTAPSVVQLVACPMAASKSMSGFSETPTTRASKSSDMRSVMVKRRASSASPDASLTVIRARRARAPAPTPRPFPSTI